MHCQIQKVKRTFLIYRIAKKACAGIPVPLNSPIEESLIGPTTNLLFEKTKFVRCGRKIDR
jgi:hypothetical protein